MTKEEILTQYLVENQAGFYRLAYSVLKNQDEALDAVQTAVCHSLERQNSLRDTGAVRSWFYRILMNACMDALRQRARVVPFPEDLELSLEDGLLTIDVTTAGGAQETVMLSLRGEEGVDA